jgi:hypothetical protein
VKHKEFEEHIKNISGLRVTAIYEYQEIHRDEGSTRRSQAMGFLIMEYEDIRGETELRPFRVIRGQVPLDETNDDLIRLTAEVLASRIVEKTSKKLVS